MGREGIAFEASRHGLEPKHAGLLQLQPRAARRQHPTRSRTPSWSKTAPGRATPDADTWRPCKQVRLVWKFGSWLSVVCPRQAHRHSSCRYWALCNAPWYLLPLGWLAVGSAVTEMRVLGTEESRRRLQNALFRKKNCLASKHPVFKNCILLHSMQEPPSKSLSDGRGTYFSCCSLTARVKSLPACPCGFVAPFCG